MLSKNNFIELFNGGLVYRYSFEDWQSLKNEAGHLYPSFRKEICLAGQKFVDELIQPLLCPIQLKSEEIDQLNKLAEFWPKIIDGQLKLAESGWLNERDLESYGLDGLLVGEEKDFYRESGYQQPLVPFVRLDLIRSFDGFKIVDINSTRPAGVGDNVVLSRLYCKNNSCKPTSLKNDFTEVIKTAYFNWSEQNNKKRPARIAILLDSLAGDWHNFFNLKNFLLEQTWVEAVDIFTNWVDFVALGYNCLLRGRIKSDHVWYNRLLNLPVSSICLISPLGRRFIGNKKWFLAWRHPLFGSLFREFLSKDYDLLMDSYYRVGVLKAGGLIVFADEYKHFSQLKKQDWILKSPSGSSGKGIIIGQNVSQNYWDSLFLKTELIGSLIQEYRPVKEKVIIADKSGQPLEKELFTKYGAFLYNGRLAGLEVMARSSSLVHGARNTYLSIAVPGKK